MKNIILIILSAVTLVAVLEALGVVDWIDKDTTVTIMDVPKSCDNGKRIPAKPLDGGGVSIKETECIGMMLRFATADKVNKRNWFFLSKTAIDSIFSKDVSANGLSLFPVVDDTDSLNIVVSPLVNDHTLISAPQGYGSFLAQTYCPTDCEVSLRMMGDAN